ncbi:MAG: hypothetical protein SAJ37_21020 [Oscillatoria sp. PMC 1068.18]|nr:hypothetical protein [Oscillatoria sp. PMC 1076.18]MEC4991225.1 hypothetical protein [Oscillatoria sp. PMC 1068.18]
MSEKKDPSKMLFSVFLGITLLFVCYGVGGLLVEARRDFQQEPKANRLDLPDQSKLDFQSDEDFFQWDEF